MNTTFGEITQPFIKVILAKNITNVLALIMFYDKIKFKKACRVLRYVILNVIKNYVCIGYIACQ